MLDLSCRTVVGTLRVTTNGGNPLEFTGLMYIEENTTVFDCHPEIDVAVGDWIQVVDNPVDPRELRRGIICHSTANQKYAGKPICIDYVLTTSVRGADTEGERLNVGIWKVNIARKIPAPAFKPGDGVVVLSGNRTFKIAAMDYRTKYGTGEYLWMYTPENSEDAPGYDWGWWESNLTLKPVADPLDSFHKGQAVYVHGGRYLDMTGYVVGPDPSRMANAYNYVLVDVPGVALPGPVLIHKNNLAPAQGA